MQAMFISRCLHVIFSMYYMYNGFYVFDFIAHCWATFNALHALLSSHIMTNKDDDENNVTGTRVCGG